MKLFIIGINGFIGSHLVEYILEHTDYSVSGIDLYDHRIKHLLSHERLEFSISDFTNNKVATSKKINECDVVILLAAIATPKTYVTNPIKVFELDFEANLWVIRQCVNKNKRLLFPSTSEVYGMCKDDQFIEEKSEFVLGPTHKTRWIYACSKQLLERIIWSYGEQGLEFTIIRPFNWIGPNQDSIHSSSGGARVIPQFVGNILRNQPIQFVNKGTQKRAFLDIDDGINAMVKILENRSASRNQIFNIGYPSNEYSIVELAQLLIDKMQYYLPERDLSLSNVSSEVSAESYYGKGYQDMDRRVPSIEKISSALNWSPTIDLGESLEKIASFYMEELENVAC